MKNWQGMRDSNSHEGFWRPSCYRYINPLCGGRGRTRTCGDPKAGGFTIPAVCHYGNSPHNEEMVWVVGLEPTAPAFRERYSSTELHPDKLWRNRTESNRYLWDFKPALDHRAAVADRSDEHRGFLRDLGTLRDVHPIGRVAGILCAIISPVPRDTPVDKWRSRLVGRVAHDPGFNKCVVFGDT